MDRIGRFRESFVTNLVARFPNHFDLQEVLGIVDNLKQQSLAVDTKGLSLYSCSQSSGEMSVDDQISSSHDEESVGRSCDETTREK